MSPEAATNRGAAAITCRSRVEATPDREEALTACTLEAQVIMRRCIHFITLAK